MQVIINELQRAKKIWLIRLHCIRQKNLSFVEVSKAFTQIFN